MTSIKQAAQVTPGGALIASQPNVVSLWKHDGDALLSATISTDTEGFWSYTYTPEGSSAAGWTLNPGPLYWSLSYLGKVRKGSTKAAAMVGSNSLLELPDLIRIMGDAHVVPGVVTGDMAVAAVAANVKVDVSAGYASVLGVGVTNPTTARLDMSAANATNPRIDTIVLELTRTAGDTEGKVVLKKVDGTAAASPVAPTLTQNATTWQFPLADVRINALATSIASVTDRRVYPTTSYTKNPTVETQARSATGAALSTVEASVAALAVTPTLLSGVWYDVEVLNTLYVDGASSVAMIAGFINGTGNLSSYVTAPAIASGIIALQNAHSLAVQGTGATITCGVLAKRSSAATVVNHYGGLTVVRAIPRI